MKKSKIILLCIGICFSLCTIVQVSFSQLNNIRFGNQNKPSLIPLPQQLNWATGSFLLNRATSIVCSDTAILAEARALQKLLAEKGWKLTLKKRANRNEIHIALLVADPSTSTVSPEAYSLDINDDKVLLTASTAHGVFNGIQTLRQLMQDGERLAACNIKDWPAFSWRGYMIDVGRNYMPMDLLKQQIDVMAAYKLNVFHFHPTEDIAWRIQIKQYPELTAAENMLRNKGKFYTESEIKELIDYCRQRHIIFVPEIDMPGHSEAFKRAMKVDMQSAAGPGYLKNILREFCNAYAVPYIHIGSDEVKITNPQFVPDMTSFIEGFGKKVIGWQPGGNFTPQTIRQLWREDNGGSMAAAGVEYIDSKHLYLNHMDTLEAVVTIFNRRMADKEHGDSLALGATLCMWHDRAVRSAEDILLMNPVYPGILAFSERTWRGGGQPGWIANISDGDTAQFLEFENRLLVNKLLYFSDKPFQYVRQTNMTWDLLGPYPNGGNLNASFEIESSLWQQPTVIPVKQVQGGTVVLKHWWAPLIKGAVDQPQENTTWYATTKIWSENDETMSFWIGFNNLSRSPATDSPPTGKWDEKGSAVWVNGKQVDPPEWSRGDQQGSSEIPLVDEGYEYRAPTKIPLKRGWNEVLIKSPVGTFKTSRWQNPVKWMFTFIPL